MPKILYEDVIEVEERVLPFNENDSTGDLANVKHLPHGQKVNNFTRFLITLRI
jgi:hypothetical protein